MEQQILEFDFKDTDKNGIFYVSEKNRFAFESITLWPNWHKKFIFIYGPEACGKSHIANLWRKKSNAQIITKKFLANIYNKKNQNLINNTRNWLFEDIDQFLICKKSNLDEKILNLINLLSEKKSFLLITSKTPPPNFSFILKDLLSRLNAFLVIEIKEPDQDLLKKIIVKRLKIRQINLTNRQILFLINRIERTYLNIKKVTDLIDKLSLQKKSNININLFKDILKSLK